MASPLAERSARGGSASDAEEISDIAGYQAGWQAATRTVDYPAPGRHAGCSGTGDSARAGAIDAAMAIARRWFPNDGRFRPLRGSDRR